MDTSSTVRLISAEGSGPAGAEQRLKELGIKLLVPPEPFGTYVEAVQTGNLLFSERDASHGRSRDEIHWARRR